MISPNQINDKFKTLPPKLKRVLVSPELFSTKNSIAFNNNLNSMQKSFLGEIVDNVLMGFEEKDNLPTKISQELNIEEDKANQITIEIENRILNNLDGIYTEIIKNIDNEENAVKEAISIQSVETKSDQIQSQNKVITSPNNISGAMNQTARSGVGQSFEQIILNQARAMQPARPADGGIMNHEARIMNEKKEPPNNLPIGDESKPIHDYKSGDDPYREPVN